MVDMKSLREKKKKHEWFDFPRPISSSKPDARQNDFATNKKSTNGKEKGVPSSLTSKKSAHYIQKGGAQCWNEVYAKRCKDCEVCQFEFEKPGLGQTRKRIRYQRTDTIPTSADRGVLTKKESFRGKTQTEKEQKDKDKINKEQKGEEQEKESEEFFRVSPRSRVNA